MFVVYVGISPQAGYRQEIATGLTWGGSDWQGLPWASWGCCTSDMGLL